MMRNTFEQPGDSIRDPIGFLARLPLASDRPWIGHGVAVVLSLAALALRFAVADELPPGFPFLTFFPAIILSAFLFGIGPGVTASVLSGLAAWYYFLPPQNSVGLSFESAVALAFFLFIVVVDISLVHWMQRANAALRDERQHSIALAENRTLLFEELQHRVGNNLQMVAALIALQKRRITDAQAREMLDHAAHRIAAIGRVQRSLYRSHGEQLGLRAFIDQVCRDALDALGRSDIRYTITGNATARLHPDKAIPTALVITEALNNAAEHAFADGQGGSIAVEVASNEEGLAVSLADDGAGLPAGFDLEQANSLGLKLASTMARSAGGRFDLVNAPSGRGTVATLYLAHADGEGAH